MDMGSGNLEPWGFSESEQEAAATPPTILGPSLDPSNEGVSMNSPLSPEARAAALGPTGSGGVMDKPQVSEEVYLQAIMETRSTDCKSNISYNEKELREAAAQEVAEQRAREKETSDGPGEPSSRKSVPQTGLGPRRKLTAEEKAAASRYRNREHARNTRLRKKAYMQKLKDLVDDLERQRKEEVRAKELAATRLRDQQNYRRTVVQEFLHLRSTADKDRNKWGRIVEEGIVFTLPITPYRYFSRSDVVHSLRMLVGIDAAISDAASLRLMAEAITCSGVIPAQKVGIPNTNFLQYHFTPENTVVSRDSIMCRWVLTSPPSNQQAQFHVEGMLYGKFSAQNRLSSVEMMFDVMTVMKQLQQISGLTCDVFIVPNTLEAALQPSASARVIIKAEPSFPVLHVNNQWTQLRGFTQEDSEGRPLDLLQYGEGPQAAVQEVLLGRPASSVVVCCKASGEGFMAALQLFPLYSHGEGVTHVLGVLRALNPTM